MIGTCKHFLETTARETGNFFISNFSRRDNSSLKALRVTGPFKGISGYEQMVRCFVLALMAENVDIELRHLPGWSPASLPAESLLEFQKPSRQRVWTGFHLHFCMPYQVKPSWGCRNINYTMFEATRLTPGWLENSLKQDFVIVPTESSRRCWVQSGFPENKIAVCPLGVDFSQFKPGNQPLDIPTNSGKPLREYRFRFLNVSAFSDRKNFPALLRVWLSATDKNDDAILILKTHLPRPEWREKFERHLCDAEERIRKRFTQAAPLVVFDKPLLPDEIPQLFAATTHYWSMSHGEGFDMPMTEAAASGLQLIAPDHSAYQDYLKPEFAHLIPSREVPADMHDLPQMNRLFSYGNWWNPDETVATELLRGLINGSVKSTQSAREALLPNYTWPNAAQQLLKILADLQK